MLFFKKKRLFNVPKFALEAPFRHRFTFIAEGGVYFGGNVVQISEKIHNKEKAYFIALEQFLKSNAEKDIKSLAVFYGDSESPECEDVLYRAYRSLDKARSK